MKNTFHLKVKGSEIFDYFIAVLLQDVLAYTGRTVTPAQLKVGFTYQKNISNNPKKPRIASVRLTEYSYPQHYAVVYTRENLRRTAVYDVIEEAHGCRFIMTQQTEKQVRGEDGKLVWIVIDPADKEKQPSLMMRLRMMAAARQIRRTVKKPALV